MVAETMVMSGLGLLALGWYAIFMIVALPILAIAWVIYMVWEKKMEAQEDAEREKGSKRLQESKGEVTDWAQQMKNFKKPERKPPKPRSPHK